MARQPIKEAETQQKTTPRKETDTLTESPILRRLIKPQTAIGLLGQGTITLGAMATEVIPTNAPIRRENTTEARRIPGKTPLEQAIVILTDRTDLKAVTTEAIVETAIIPTRVIETLGATIDQKCLSVTLDHTIGQELLAEAQDPTTDRVHRAGDLPELDQIQDQEVPDNFSRPMLKSRDFVALFLGNN